VQSPVVVSLLAALFTVLGLNLAGCSSSQPAQQHCQRPGAQPDAGFLLSGVLAVACLALQRPSGCLAGLCHRYASGAGADGVCALGSAWLAYLLASFVPSVVGWLPRPALDADLPPRHGFPHVCHCGLAGLGAGPSGRHGCRCGPAGPAAGAGRADLGPGPARQEPHEPRASPCCWPLAWPITPYR
jgi:hypothetical protein